MHDMFVTRPSRTQDRTWIHSSAIDLKVQPTKVVVQYQSAIEIKGPKNDNLTSLKDYILAARR